MSDSSQPALVLDDSSVAHGEPVHFSGFPGLWIQGEPVAVSELGFETADEAFARVEELGLPLTETSVGEGEGLMPARDNHMPGLDEVRGTEWQPDPGQPGAELAPGEVFPPASLTEGEIASAVEPALEPNADEVIASVADIDDVVTLDALEQSEKAGKNRKTVLAAIDARRVELTPPVEPEVEA